MALAHMTPAILKWHNNIPGCLGSRSSSPPPQRPASVAWHHPYNIALSKPKRSHISIPRCTGVHMSSPRAQLSWHGRLPAKRPRHSCRCLSRSHIVRVAGQGTEKLNRISQACLARAGSAHCGGLLGATAASFLCAGGCLPKPPAPRMKLVISFSATTSPLSAHLLTALF